MLHFQFSQIFQGISKIPLNDNGYDHRDFVRLRCHSFADPLHQNTQKCVGIKDCDTLVKIRVHAGKLDGDSTEKITNEVRSVLAEKSALVRRMMRAFPEARLYNGKIIMIMRERRLQLRKEIKQAKKKTKQRIQMTER